ncbi:MAG: AAA family ATPase [Promethearchaeota archaeon]
MVRANELIELFKKIANKDNEGFIDTSLKIINSEKKKNHYKLANSLISLLEQIQDNTSLAEPWIEEFSTIPLDRDRMIELFLVNVSKKNLNDIILNLDTEKTIRKILEEWKERTYLSKYGMHPINKILFYGPPGCGKTLCASILAGEMKIPILEVKTDILVSSLLGETSVNLRKVFESVHNSKRAILFFDEFDAIAKSRLDSQEHGEIRRSVSNLLNFIENAPKNILIIVATNHPKVLDIAVWRRFDEIVEFPLPKPKEIKELIKLKLKNYKHDIDDYEELINKLNNLSHADIEHICHSTIKFAVLNKIEIINQSLLLKKSDEFLKKKAKLNKALNNHDKK